MAWIFIHLDLIKNPCSEFMKPYGLICEHLIGSHMMGCLALDVGMGELWVEPHLFGSSILWLGLLI